MVDIWVPKPILEPKDPLTALSRVEGRVRLKVFKEGVKEPRVDTGWFKNLVLDGGLDRLGTVSIPDAISRCAVGTSNTPVSSSQTALLAQVATSATSFGSATSGYEGTYGVGDGRYKYHRRFIQFAEGAAAGVLREIGFTESADTNATNLTARALITDGAGNPTDVTVLSDEILQVTYEFRHYLDDSDGSIAFEMSGVPYTGIYRPGSEGTSPASILYPGSAGGNFFQLGGTNGTFGAAGAGIGNTSGSGPNAGTRPAYSNGNHYRDVSYPFTLSQGNSTGGILMFGWSSGTASPGYKFLLDTPIPKDNTKLMTLNIRTSWGRK